jgi:Phosphomannomutase
MLDSIGRAKEWVAYDPNEKTKNYVTALLDTLDTKDSKTELESLFPGDGSRIGFGTAGLRSAMKPGPLGMNDLVIIQTTQGLARYCQKAVVDSEDSGTSGNCKDKDDKKLLAVIGYDHRARPDLDLSSKNFAFLACAVFLEAGFDCVLFDRYVATPIVAYAITRLDASVGIMVTASHNPKDDAGFKVYWKDGCQIRSPVDGYIANSITEEDNLRPWTDYSRFLQVSGNTNVTESIIKDYYQAVASSGLVTGQSLKFRTHNNHVPKVCYTAMHGVGYLFAVEIFQTFGFDKFYSVPEQQEPDYSFRTVPFPNPEEDGALLIAMDFANKNGCDVIFANDPDADRLAVAERCPASGQWTVFTGDQIGTMLGAWIWDTIGKKCGKPVAMCASTVSSKMLSVIAQVEGFHFEDTLTGFKWIGSRMVQLRQEGYRSLFGYEEAIGFCCGDVVADKDGLSALGTMSELVFHTYGNGMNLSKHLQSLYDKYGEFCSNNGYFFCYEPATIHNIFNDMRNNGDYMTNVGPYEVESIRDLGFPGYDSTTSDKKPTLPVSKSSPMITIYFKNGTVAQFRASGTEPKFKYYIEMRGKPGVARDVVEKDLKQMSNYILEELLQPTKNGLKRTA